MKHSKFISISNKSCLSISFSLSYMINVFELCVAWIYKSLYFAVNFYPPIPRHSSLRTINNFLAGFLMCFLSRLTLIGLNWIIIGKDIYHERHSSLTSPQRRAPYRQFDRKNYELLCDNTLRLTISFSLQRNAIIDDKNNNYDTQTQTYLDLSINFPTLLLILSYSLLPVSTFSSVTRGKTWENLGKKEEKSWKIFLSHSLVFWVSVSSSLSFFFLSLFKNKKLLLHLLSELFKNFFILFLPLTGNFYC